MPADDYQIVNSVTETPAPNTTIIEEHNTYTTNPTTVVYQNTVNDNKVTDTQFLNLFHQLTTLINQTNQQNPTITRDLFAKQVDKIYEKSNDSTDNVQDNLDTLQTNNAASFATELLTVTGNTDIDGNTTVGGDLSVAGSITAGILNVSALSSAGALVAPYFTATSTTATNTFMGNVGIGTTTPSSKLTVVGNIDISTGSAYTYNGANVITASTTLNNYFFGGAGNLTMTGAGNTGSGYRALLANTTGAFNTANGYNALYSNTTGFSNVASGYTSLYFNTTGTQNTATGRQSLHSNTTGSNNVAYGYNALYFNTTGSNNIANGSFSLYNNISGNQNVTSGYASLYSNTTGSNNIALGYNAGRYIADGVTGNSTTSNSVFLGYDTRSLTANDTNQIVIGYQAIGNGSNSVTLGNTSITKTILQGSVGIGTTTPSSKLAVVDGTGSLIFQNSSQNNLYVSGTNASVVVDSISSSFPSFLIKVGGSIRGQLAAGTNPTGVGLYAGGTSNGIDVLASGNIGIGTTTPSAKLTVAQSADSATGGFWLSTSDNTDLRSQFMNTSGVLSFYGGDTAGTLNTATLNAAGEWTNASDISYKENIEKLSYGLDTVLALQPRSYDIKNTDNHRIGFVAQEVEEVIPEVVSGEDGSKGISYGNLVAVAISAIQELAEKVSGFAESFTSKFITANEVKTDKLCVGQTCITETELIEFLNQSNQSSAPSQSTTPAVEKDVQENTEVTPETAPEINTESVVNEAASEIPKPPAVTEIEEVIDTNVDSGENSSEESTL